MQKSAPLHARARAFARQARPIHAQTSHSRVARGARPATGGAALCVPVSVLVRERERERYRVQDLLCGKLIDAATKVAFFIEGEGRVVILRLFR